MGKAKKKTTLALKDNCSSPSNDEVLTDCSSPGNEEVTDTDQLSPDVDVTAVFENHLQRSPSSRTDEPFTSLSSFHHFKLPKSLCLPSGSIYVGAPSSPNLCVSNSIDDNKNCGEQMSTLPSYPNILRHNRSDLQKPKICSSPMKTLTFSPSKFLNTSLSEINEKLDANSIKDSSTSVMTDHDDSGIVIHDLNLSENPGIMPLTSTPSSSSRRKALLQHINESSPVTNYQLQTASMSESFQCEKTIRITPLIVKFLNTSVPKTPTPIKFPSGQKESMKQKHQPFETTMRSHSVSEVEEFQPEMIKIKDELQHHDLSATPKQITKAQSVRFRRNLFDTNDKCDTKRMKLIKIECKTSKHGHKIFLKRHKTVPYGKVVCESKTEVRRERTKSLNEEWVSIACGRSYDQKVMTAAAKKCIHGELNNSLFEA